MFWADKIAKEISEKGSGKEGPLLIRDEKTASGRVHVGSMRGVAVHGVVSEALKEKQVENTYLFEINDFDPMDGLPVYLDEAKYKPYMGKPLYLVPSPDPKFKNYAEYYGQEFEGVIRDAGFYPKFTRTSELYQSGKMNDVIRLALEKAEVIRAIYKEISGSVKEKDWLPISVICEKCGKIGTTRAMSFDGEKVRYVCEPSMVEWAQGCGHTGEVSPYDGNAKLPWKVEWPAKWKALGVDVEGAGKDHSTKGGAREVADRISREVFGYEPPHNIYYEFFLVGGKKMSSSKGHGSSAKEISELLPPEIFRLALIGKEPRQAIDFDPEGDTIPVLFDTYDSHSIHFFDGVLDDYARLFYYAHPPAEGGIRSLVRRFLPRFSQVAFIIQMRHLNLLHEVEVMRGSPLAPEDKEEAEKRARYAKIWLEKYAPENFRYILQEKLPEVANHFSDTQKEALRAILNYLEQNPKLDGQTLHAKLHEIRKETNVEAKEFFSAIYLAFLGKDSGPKAGWFLSVLDRDFLIKRLQEVV